MTSAAFKFKVGDTLVYPDVHPGRSYRVLKTMSYDIAGSQRLETYKLSGKEKLGNVDVELRNMEIEKDALEKCFRVQSEEGAQGDG